MPDKFKVEIVINEANISVTTYMNRCIVRSLHALSGKLNWRFISAELEQVVYFVKELEGEEITGNILVLVNDDKVQHMLKYYELAHGIKFQVI